MQDLRTPENIALLKKMAKSHLAYFVKTVRQYPTGCRSDHAFYDKPIYRIMRRPVGPDGVKSEFWGTKVTCMSVGTTDREEADRVCFNYNFNFHEHFLRTGKRW